MTLYNKTYDKIQGEILTLKLISYYEGNEKELPYYWFDIIENVSQTSVGKISIRIGHNYHSYYNGNIGYEINEEYRGFGYAYIASCMVIDIAKTYKMDNIYLTCNEDNIASYKTIEKLGAVLKEIVKPPKDFFAYSENMERYRIYKLNLNNICFNTNIVINKYDDFFKLINLLDYDWNDNFTKNINKIKQWVNSNLKLFYNTIYYDSIIEVENFYDIKNYDTINYHLYRKKVLKLNCVEYYYVYKHILPNNATYIGVTCQKELDFRWQKGEGYKNNNQFYSMIKKYGWNNVRSEILFQNVSSEEISDLEKRLIREDKIVNCNNLNSNDGGEGIIERYNWSVDYLYQYRSHKVPFKFIIDISEKEEFIKRIRENGEEIIGFLDINNNQRYVVVNHVSYKQRILETLLQQLKSRFYKQSKVTIEKYYDRLDDKTFYYDSNTNNIKINLSFVDQRNYSLEKAVYSLIHEFRHSIQIAILKGEIAPIGVCDNNLLKTAYMYIDYKDNLKEYFLQQVELDAYAFAEVYMQIAFHDLQLIKSYTIQNEYEKIGELHRLIEYMELIKTDFF